MRQDQYDALQQLNVKLTDVFLKEADPDQWPGHSTPPLEMTKEQRGDRYWHKKNAVATIAIMMRVGNLVDIIQRNTQGGGGGAEVADEDAMLDKQISEAEAEGNRLLDQVMKEQRRTEFVKKAVGKTP